MSQHPSISEPRNLALYTPVGVFIVTLGPRVSDYDIRFSRAVEEATYCNLSSKVILNSLEDVKVWVRALERAVEMGKCAAYHPETARVVMRKMAPVTPPTGLTDCVEWEGTVAEARREVIEFIKENQP